MNEKIEKMFIDKDVDFEKVNQTLTLILNKQNERILELENSNKILKTALEDFRDFGTRHDINPTGMFKKASDGTTFFDSLQEDSWQGYIRSQDKSVRDRAKSALEQLNEKKV